MGWTSFHKEPHEKPLDALKREFSRDGQTCVIDGGRVGSTWYLAFRTQDNHVLGVIVLTSTRQRDYHNFGYKEMEEGAGPTDSRCPARILNQLSPLEDLYSPDSSAYKWAQAWRERCRANLARPRTRLQVGDILRWPRPIEYVGGPIQELVVVDTRRRLALARTDNGALIRTTIYRLPSAATVHQATIIGHMQVPER